MTLSQSNILACPIDGKPLEYRHTPDSVAQWVCDSGHAFDVARKGYVNLLPVQQKKSKDPGDSKAMVGARTRFLESGLYQPIAEQLTQLVHAQLPATNLLHILDAGCGDGYYLSRLQTGLVQAEETRACNYIGLDISKWAIQAAARRNAEFTWLVASNRHPPLLDHSIDVIFCLFGFPEFSAFHKILRADGIIILADPAEHHLLELREILYPTIRKNVPKAINAAQAAGFEIHQTLPLHYKCEDLTNAQIVDLMQMTPHLYRASHAGKIAAEQLSRLSITVDIQFRLLRKT